MSMCAVPLSVAGRVLGALRFSFDERKLFDEDERGFVLALAAQTAQTLQRTELYQAERRAAARPAAGAAAGRAYLRSRAGTSPPTTAPRATRRRAATSTTCCRSPAAAIVAVVGDVMGRGLDAAASMAQVRTTIRAYAVEDPDPVTVFRRVDAFFAWTRIEQLVTMVYLLIDPSAGTVQLGQRRPRAAVAGGRRRLRGQCRSRPSPRSASGCPTATPSP